MKKAIDILTQYVKKIGTKGIYHTLAIIYRDRQNEDAEKIFKTMYKYQPIKRMMNMIIFLVKMI